MNKILKLFSLFLFCIAIKHIDAMGAEPHTKKISALDIKSLTRELFKVIARNGSFQEVINLIEQGAAITAREATGKTFLHWAAERGFIEACRALIIKGADVDARTLDARTPLFLASFNGHAAVAELLIDNKATIDATCTASIDFDRIMADKPWLKKCKKCTPLHAALSQGHEAVALLLVERGANVNQKSHQRQTALHLAAISTLTPVTVALLEKKAEVNAENAALETPLVLACQTTGPYRDEENVTTLSRVLIENKANPNPHPDCHETPLFCAAWGLSYKLCELLLKKGAEVNQRCWAEQDDSSSTPLHIVLNGEHDNNDPEPKAKRTAIASLLVKHNADIHAHGNGDDGWSTPLELASRYGNIDLCKFFITQGVQITEQSLADSAEQGDCTQYKMLLRHMLLKKLSDKAPVISLAERRRQMKLALLTLNRLQKMFGWPRDIVQLIARSGDLLPDFIACQYAYYCCNFRLSPSVTKDMLCSCLGEENISALKETMQKAYEECKESLQYATLKLEKKRKKFALIENLPNPANFDQNIQELFLNPDRSDCNG